MTMVLIITTIFGHIRTFTYHLKLSESRNTKLWDMKHLEFIHLMTCQFFGSLISYC